MVTQIMSRSERRMEKKQAFLLLILVLAVALVSFALGVMVGRAGGRPVAEIPSAPERLPVAQAPAADAPSAETAAPGADHLTFYDALPKGEQPPLGSGINLPPEEGAPKTPQGAAKPAAGATPDGSRAGDPPRKQGASGGENLVSASSPVAKPEKKKASPTLPQVTEKPAPKPAERAASSPAPSSAKGTVVIQAASYPDATGARKLRDRLAGKGFGAYIEEVDLGSKGKWHRVLVGPYESDQAASAAASRLKSEENVSVLVRRK